MNERDAEVLRITQEECAEVIHAVSKVFRFGLHESYNGFTNKERLEEEVGDLQAMVDLAIEFCILDDGNVNKARKAKRDKLLKYSNIFGKATHIDTFDTISKEKNATILNKDKSR